jgi:hypothetical protein
MAPPGGSSPVGDTPDDLERIAGLDPWIAQLIRDSGIARLSALAALSPAALATFLRERAAAALAPDRIEREDWLGQARRLSEAQEPEAGEPAAVPRAEERDEPGRQQAGFSLFFDVVRDEGGRDVWQTRAYHEESGAEIALPGIEPGPWVAWILAQALSTEGVRQAPADDETVPTPPPLHHLLVSIVGARLVGRTEGADPRELSVEVRLEVSGLDALERALGRTALSSLLRADR